MVPAVGKLQNFQASDYSNVARKLIYDIAGNDLRMTGFPEGKYDDRKNPPLSLL